MDGRPIEQDDVSFPSVLFFIFESKPNLAHKTMPQMKFDLTTNNSGEDVEEQDGLLGSASPSKASAKQHRTVVRGWMQYAFLVSLTAAAFAAGYVFHARSSHHVVGGANRVMDDSDHISGAIEDEMSDETSPMFNASFTEYLTSGMKKILERNKFGMKKTYYIYDSPYNLRWPGREKPTWVKKLIPYNKNVPIDKQICFTHVGKAGGSTGEFIIFGVSHVLHAQVAAAIIVSTPPRSI